ncbi:hypothetical protein GJ744_005290 [Endocarpon pusillum]|uniref:Flavoprotein domain-containing protein n=1 Tax=Endocarpon pusillum TaxID=364733 RepID=A0A8H7E5C3_9EURO|nr:hypothetical protein GJ744_005290 [Endocarpon pusillum]
MGRDRGSSCTKAGNGAKANILLYLADRIAADAILPHVSLGSNCNIRVIRKQRRPEVVKEESRSFPEVDIFTETRFAIWEDECGRLAQQSHQHARWADILFVEMDADTISAMLAGLAYDTVLAILRCWNTSKRVVILPQLSIDQWKSPIWKRQITEIQSNWKWIQLLRPALWDMGDDGAIISESAGDWVWDWQGPEEAVRAIQTEAQKIIHGDQTNTLSTDTSTNDKFPSTKRNLLRNKRSPTRPRMSLPPEIWTLILEYLGDWEYATALGIYTTLPTPHEWLPHMPKSASQPGSLEYTLLTARYATIRTTLDNNSSAPCTLSPLAIKLIFKFSLTPILSHLASHQKDIFWTSFGLGLIPYKASVTYNSPTILEWWRSEPAILKKEYGSDSLDGASRAGFLDVLDWWAHSGLEMRYTEKALESASAKGHLDVLEWWKKTSRARHDDSAHQHPPLPLKVGKSILAAAQSGRAATVAWWDRSGIPYSHEEGVARLASTHGHVNVLELWRELKGSKMIFDNQVLVGATKNGHADVLEWWKTRSGMRIEYKTCDIEEAMEDSLGGSGEAEVRDWWERNGLNLGVGTSEWMKVKMLGN